MTTSQDTYNAILLDIESFRAVVASNSHLAGKLEEKIRAAATFYYSHPELVNAIPPPRS